MSRISNMSISLATRCFAGATLLGLSLFATPPSFGAMVDGTVFSDDFNGASLSASWTPPGSPEVDPTSSLTVSGGLVTMVGGDAGYNYISMWGDTTQLAGLGTSIDWWAEVRFQITGSMATPDSNRPINLLSGRTVAGGIGNNEGIDLRLEQDGTGASGSTFNLSWNGFHDADLFQIATTIATGLTKDEFHTVSTHRKNDGTVDIFLNGNLVSTQAVLGTSNPLLFRIGESSGTASLYEGSLAIDFVRVGGAAVPEPHSIVLIALCGLCSVTTARKKS